MPRDSNGNTSPLPGTIVSQGDTIEPSQHNPALVDLYAMMTQSLSRDGQGGMRAPLNLNGYPITNLGPSEDPGSAASVAQLQGVMPIGSVIDFCGSSSPSGWLLCFGQAISRTSYADLFSVIGVSFGSGNGTTTFNVPDLRGRVIAGIDNMGGTAAGRVTTAISGINGSIRGSSGGSQSHTLTIDQMPSHNHGGFVSTSGSHAHNIPRGLPGSVGQYAAAAGQQPDTSFSSSLDGLHNHTISPQGGGAYHNNMQPTLILNKIIKVSY